MTFRFTHTNSMGTGTALAATAVETLEMINHFRRIGDSIGIILDLGAR